MRAALIYPHQLVENFPKIRECHLAVLVADPLFVSQYKFHPLKLSLHRVSMMLYAAEIRARTGIEVIVLEAGALSASTEIGGYLTQLGISRVVCVEFVDFWLEKNVRRCLKEEDIELEVLPSPSFLTPVKDLELSLANKKKLYFTKFYIEQRHRFSILLDKGSPIGGKWSFDVENRKKLPKEDTTPKVIDEEEELWFPTTHLEARNWFEEFLIKRFAKFGEYEDAISYRESTLYHSVLTPALNIGLITPKEILDRTLTFVNDHEGKIPLNSLEGFLRQIIGWREFVRGVYLFHGNVQRTRNFWCFTRSLPQSFYDGSTGVFPFDYTVKKVQQVAYAHHIERLMVLGSFMMLCEIEPDSVYQWFMELFIDAYDWVMVPNVYGMSQYADGGLMTTKPYLSGANYLKKMGDYPSGEWEEIWNALYWRFIEERKEFLVGNQRMRLIVAQLEKMEVSKRVRLIKKAEDFLHNL
jgi:deoxyribodipyrimidine photolyase-related protein